MIVSVLWEVPVWAVPAHFYCYHCYYKVLFCENTFQELFLLSRTCLLHKFFKTGSFSVINAEWLLQFPLLSLSVFYRAWRHSFFLKLCINGTCEQQNSKLAPTIGFHLSNWERIFSTVTGGQMFLCVSSCFWLNCEKLTCSQFFRTRRKLKNSRNSAEILSCLLQILSLFWNYFSVHTQRQTVNLFLLSESVNIHVQVSQASSHFRKKLVQTKNYWNCKLEFVFMGVFVWKLDQYLRSLMHVDHFLNFWSETFL